MTMNNAGSSGVAQWSLAAYTSTELVRMTMNNAGSSTEFSVYWGLVVDLITVRQYVSNYEYMNSMIYDYVYGFMIQVRSNGHDSRQALSHISYVTVACTSRPNIYLSLLASFSV